LVRYGFILIYIIGRVIIANIIQVLSLFTIID